MGHVRTEEICKRLKQWQFLKLTSVPQNALFWSLPVFTSYQKEMQFAKLPTSTLRKTRYKNISLSSFIIKNFFFFFINLSLFTQLLNGK